MIRIGLAGLGIHGGRYARHLLAGDVAGAVLTAVSRADADAGRAFAREHGIAFERDPEALAVRPDVDAVIVVLRPDLHHRVARACLDAGRPVLVEKPLAHDLGAAEDLVARDPLGRRLMVAHTLRFDAVVAEFRRRLPDLGRLDLVSVGQHFGHAGRPWLDDPGAGGLLRNTAIHGFDLLRHLIGREPTAVAAEVARRTTARTEDLAVAIVRFGEDGPVGVVRGARTSTGRAGHLEAVGERGVLTGDFVHRTLVLARDGSARPLGPVPATPTLPVAMTAFVAAISGGAIVPVPATEGAAAVRLVEAAGRAARTGARVAVGPPECHRNETPE